MRKSFSGYYRPSEEEFVELWENCLFVVDANVLLNLYRYPKGARNDLLKALKQVSTRMWIPHQAALEYQENRLGVIAEQVKKFDDVRKILSDSINGLRSELAGLQLKKRHSAIDPDGFLNRVEGEFSKFETELTKLEKEQPDVFSEDTLRIRIDDLLNGKVGNPFAAAELEKIYQEGKTRYEQKYPPGYGDLAKGNPTDKGRLFYFCNGTVIRREYGDLILWFQIINEAKTKGIKRLVFITDDEKDDWWWIAESKGKKTIGPRPELVNEITHKADVALFYMYNSERFLKYAQQYLGIEIKQESIKQVQEIAQLRRTELEAQSIHAVVYHVEQAVAEWVRSLHPHDKVFFGERMDRGVEIDIVRVNQETGQRVGYEIKFVRSNRSRSVPLVILREVVQGKSPMLLERGNLNELKFVFVFEDESWANKWRNRIAHESEKLPEHVSIVIGLIVPNDKSEGIRYRFIPLPEF